MSSSNRDLYLHLVEQHSTLDGRFTNIKRLGSSGGNGSFSLLFQATDLTTNQDVALKFYNPDERKNSYRWDSFIREEEILRELVGQPDIIGWRGPLTEYNEPLAISPGFTYDIPFAYYAVELASKSVGAAIANDSWSSEQCIAAFQPMSRAIQRIHNLQIVHRDLKPDNFLVMPDGKIKLADFGTARHLNGKSPALSDQYFGPPGDVGYTPPEMLACIHESFPEIAFGADIFALGAILFELCCGTQLIPLLYDQSFIVDLVRTMSAVPGSRRPGIYHQFVREIAAAHPLPSLEGLDTTVPASIRRQVDKLYRSLAALDYRERFTDFQSIFRQIAICLLILRNEDKYRSQLRMRRRRKVAFQEAIVTRGVQI